MQDTAEFLQLASNVLIGNYARFPVVMVRGEGAMLWDSDGNQYIDCFAGFGGGIVGHCHPALVEAVSAQAKKLWHVGNTFHTEPQVLLAQKLSRTAFAGQAFFCHSGAEANEAAVKLARLRGSHHSPRKWKIVSLHKSFHGRTLAMIAATGNPKVKVGFEPLVPGFVNVAGGDFGALEQSIDAETAAVIMEPIQGEGGINEYPADYAAKVRQMCTDRQVTLIFDEVWTGCGRTGKWFGHQHFLAPDGKPVVPDIMTLGKALGGGLPAGAMWANPEIAKLLVPGTHGCTLGGNPICMAAANAVFEVIEKEGLLDRATRLGQSAVERLKSEKRIASKIAQIRGKGLFLGIELREAPDKFVDKCLEKKVIFNLTASKVIRIAPPLNIQQSHWDKALDTLIEIISGL